MCRITRLISSAKFHYQRDRVAAEPVSNNDLTTTATLQRIVRQIEPFSILDRFLSDIAYLPGRMFQRILQIIQSILHSVSSAIQSLLDNIDSIVGNLMTDQNNRTTASPNQRRRRSADLISPLPDLIRNSLKDFQNILYQIENTTSSEIGTVMDTVAKIVWNFFNTEMLPWVHRILERLGNSSFLPSSLRNLMQTLEAMYTLLRMAGYVSWFDTVWKSSNFDSRKLYYRDCSLASFLLLELVKIASVLLGFFVFNNY